MVVGSFALVFLNKHNINLSLFWSVGSWVVVSFLIKGSLGVTLVFFWFSTCVLKNGGSLGQLGSVGPVLFIKRKDK